MSSLLNLPLVRRYRPAISRAAYQVRQQIGRLDDPEVRKARKLARLARSGKQLDVLAFGDSAFSFVAPYDQDRRNLATMLRDEIGPSRSFHTLHGGSYNPLLYLRFIRLLEGTDLRPLVILPLTARVRTLPWVVHPVHGYQRVSDFLATVNSATPVRKIRRGFPRPTSKEFAAFHQLPFATWAGDLRIGDYVTPLKSESLSADEAVRLLYAYHHGGTIEPGPHLDVVTELGARLRDLGVPVVVYEDSIPVVKGVELFGQSFYDLAEQNLQTAADAFCRGYGDATFVRSGLTAPTAEFIDWRDGTEHLNAQGRTRLSKSIGHAVRSVLDDR